MKRILIVEDSSMAYKRFKTILEEGGFNVEPYTKTYNEALERLEENRPDFVVIDIELIGPKTGLDLASYITEHYRVPFMFLTFYDDLDLVKKANRSYPSAYLLKKDKADVDERQLLVEIERGMDAGVDTNRKQGNMILVEEGIIVDDNGRKLPAEKKIWLDAKRIVYIKPTPGRQNLLTIYAKTEKTDTLLNEPNWKKTKLTEYLRRETLGHFLKLLPEYFIRIHDGTVVNLNEIQASSRAVLIYVTGGKDLRVSSKYQAAFKEEARKRGLNL